MAVSRHVWHFRWLCLYCSVMLYIEVTSLEGLGFFLLMACYVCVKSSLSLIYSRYVLKYTKICAGFYTGFHNQINAFVKWPNCISSFTEHWMPLRSLGNWWTYPLLIVNNKNHGNTIWEGLPCSGDLHWKFEPQFRRWHFEVMFLQHSYILYCNLHYICTWLQYCDYLNMEKL